MTAELKLHLSTPWSEEFDCYECARTFYIENYDLTMREYARPDDWWVKAPQLDLLRSNFLAEGWVAMPGIHRRDLALGDGLLMSIGGKVISHCAIYLENNWFYHAPFRETARKDLWAGYWKDRTMLVIRHPQVYKPIERSQWTSIVCSLLSAKGNTVQHQLASYRTPGPERVGLILKNGDIVELNNISPQPDQSFSVAPEDMIANEFLAIATWHTHPREKHTCNLSGEDYLGFLGWPNYLHLIIGSNGVRGYIIDAGVVLKDARQDHPAWEFVGDVAV